MANFKRTRAVAFGIQSTEGTVDPTIAALNGPTGALSDGFVRGDPDVGDDGSGIEFTSDRNEEDGGFVDNSFTALDGAFIREDVTFSFSFPLCGVREDTAATPVDADFTHLQGINAILSSIGLFGVGSGTPGWAYLPADAGFISVKIFDGDQSWVLEDVKCETATIDCTPATVPIMKCDFSAVVNSRPSVTFPVVDYGVQDTVNPEAIKAVNPQWGIGGEVRGWEELTVTLGNELEATPDSASLTGEYFQQVGREIEIAMKIRQSDTDEGFEGDNLVGTTAPTDDLTFTVGTAAGATSPALAFTMRVNNLRVKSNTPEGSGVAYANLTAQATGTTDGSEFSIEFI